MEDEYGSIFIGGSYYASAIELNEGTLIFDTKSGCFLVEGGAHGEAQLVKFNLIMEM